MFGILDEEAVIGLLAGTFLACLIFELVAPFLVGLREIVWLVAHF